jgi:hypothetical protein
MSSKLRQTATLALTAASLLLASACQTGAEPTPEKGTGAQPILALGCGGPGICKGKVYCEGGSCSDPGSVISIVMCQCALLDPACGLGSCDGGAYSTGENCASPVSYPPGSPVSQAICGNATIDPQSCCAQPGGPPGPPDPVPCAPSWGPGTYHDTYFRDSTGTNFTYPIVGSPVLPGYQVCDYDASVTHSECDDLFGEISSEPILQSSYCQQFTDASNAVLSSIAFTPPVPVPSQCPPIWGPGTYTDTYFRDSTGTNYLYPIVGSPVLPGYQVCDYDASVTPSECDGLWGFASFEPILQNSYCQQFLDASDGMLLSIGFTPDALTPEPCAPSWGPGTYHDTYFRDSTGTNFTYPVVGSPVLPGYQVCDYTSSVTHAECAALAGVSSSEPILQNSYCQQFTDASDSVLNSISFTADPLAPHACAQTWGPGTYHDTYFRDSTGTNYLYPIIGSPVLPGYQVCDYDAAVTHAECAALAGVSSSQPILQNSYCQQFTDASNAVLSSIAFH